MYVGRSQVIHLFLDPLLVDRERIVNRVSSVGGALRAPFVVLFPRSAGRDRSICVRHLHPLRVRMGQGGL